MIGFLVILALTTPADDALNAVNFYRSEAGLSRVNNENRIVAAAQKHAEYLAINWDDPRYEGTSWHTQLGGLPGFTGQTATKRCEREGFTECCIFENIAFSWNMGARAEKDVATWMETVFHRIPIIKPNLKFVGYGMANDQSTYFGVQNYFVTGSDENKYVIYPADNQKDVPLEFTGNEAPEPYPDARYPVGYPVTVMIPQEHQSRARVLEYWIKDSRLREQEIHVVPENNRYFPGTFAMSTKSPLREGERYTAYVKIKHSRDEYTFTWDFTTMTKSAVYRIAENISWLYQPAKNLLVCQSPLDIPFVVNVFDIQGRLQGHLKGESEISWRPELPNGVYFVKMQDANGNTQSGKIVVKR